VTTRDEDAWDNARAEAYITELRRASAAGELYEEIPWTAEDEAGTGAMWERLHARWARWARREEAAATAQRRRARRRRRAWRMPRKDA
jgi:hypothetical protein